MIDKMIMKSGSRYDQNYSMDTLPDPLISGYFFVHIRLPEAVKQIISNNQEIEDLFIYNAVAVDLPSDALQTEVREHGKGLKSMIPTGKDVSTEFTIRLLETKHFDIIETLQIWDNCIINPVTYRSIIKKKSGDSWLNLIKSTITVYVFPPTVLSKPENILVLKFYGSHVNNINYSELQTDYAQNNLVVWNIPFQFDRFVPLTKSSAVLLNMSKVYRQSIEILYQNLNNIYDYAHSDLVRMLDDLVKSWST